MSGFVQDYAFWNWQFLSCKSIHSQSFSASCTAWPDPDCTAMECRTMRGWCRRRGMIRDGRSNAGQVWVVGLVWGLSLYYDCLHFLHWFVMALQGMMKSWLIVSHCCGLRTHRNQNEAKMKAAASLFKQTNNFPTKQLPQIHANIQGAVKQSLQICSGPIQSKNPSFGGLMQSQTYNHQLQIRVARSSLRCSIAWMLPEASWWSRIAGIQSLDVWIGRHVKVL